MTNLNIIVWFIGTIIVPIIIAALWYLADVKNNFTKKGKCAVFLGAVLFIKIYIDILIKVSF